jgi:virginiamycin B lyase
MRHGLRLLPLTLGACVAIATGAASAQAYVYWGIAGPDGSGGTTLGRADLDGSGVTHSFAGGASNPGPIAIDGAHIYWANDGTGSIGRANLNGSDPDPTWIPNLGESAAGIAVDGSYIYWTDSEAGYIGRATLAGTDVKPTFIDVGAETSPEGIAVQSGTIYVGTLDQIKTVDATGGTPLLLGPSLGSNLQVLSLAIAGGYVYFGLFPNGAIGRMTTIGTGETTSFVTGLGIPGGVASDGTYLYWADTTDGEIGRALLASEGATNIEDNFINEPNDPTGLAVDGGIDPTTTTVSCVPSTLSVGAQSACTATVGDSASTSVPTGTVSFTASGGAFFLGNPCTLTPDGGGQASCTLGGELTTAGTQTITARYAGDPVHEPSSATVSLCAGTSIQCGGKPPSPPAKPQCVVPKLKGKTLAQARAALKKAHCSLGKVKKPKHSHGTLHVSSSKPAAGKKLANGAKVAVTLAARRRRR